MSAYLNVFHYNGLIKTLNLTEGEKYVIGRKNTCAVTLDDYKGISREHFEIQFEDGFWKLTVLSQFGSIQVNGDNINSLVFEHNKNFELPPYRFEFVLEANEEPVREANDSGESTSPVINQDSSVPADDFDRTVVGQIQSVPFLKVLSNDDGGSNSKKLEGHSPWSIGRDTKSSFVIDDSQVSRNQFEILKVGNTFFIKDLGSVNGTMLNSKKLKANKEVPLNSGDLIQVLTHMYEFEIHDNDFSERIDSNALVAALGNEEISGSSYIEQPQQSLNQYIPPQNYGIVQHTFPQGSYSQPGLPQPPFVEGPDRKKLIFRVAIGLIGAIAVFFGLADNETKKPMTAGKEIKEMTPISKLSVEQQTVVQQNYNLAKNYFMQGKYSSARSEIIKMKELVPEHLDSEELLKLSEEAMYMQEQKIKAEQVEQAKKETEEKIVKRVAECRKIITPRIETHVMEDCLAEVLQFNPEHPAFAELRGIVEGIVTERSMKESERRRFQGLVSQLRGIFESARKVESHPDPLKSIAAYEKVIEAKLPDPEGLKRKAVRKIASIKTQMSDKGARLSSDADNLHSQQKLRAAILTLRKALKVNPLDEEAPLKIELWTKELRKQTMELYQEGILEESYGNIEGGESKPGAKDKWKKIIEIDIPDGEYFKKASIKLRKYGA